MSRRMLNDLESTFMPEPPSGGFEMASNSAPSEVELLEDMLYKSKVLVEKYDIPIVVDQVLRDKSEDIGVPMRRNLAVDSEILTRLLSSCLGLLLA